MRLRFALPALAGGLMIGCSAFAATTASPAAAPTPPSAPIFYCPTAPKSTPAACPPAAKAAPAAPAAPAVHAGPAAPAAQAAPAAHVQMRKAVSHRRLRRRVEMRIVERRAVERGAVDWRRADLSEGQMFIHDYERRHHGLEVGEADEAWANAGPPPCPEQRCPPRHAWAEAPPPPRQVIVERAAPPPPPVIVEHPPAPPPVIVERAPPAPQQVIVERAPPPPQQVIIEREAPPPPKIIIEHPPAPPPRVIFERAPAPPPVVIHERATPCPERCPGPRDYGWQSRGEGGRVVIERRERERAGGWRYAEANGRGHYEAWGDARRARPCPPAVPLGGCSADAGHAAAYESSEWQDGSYGHVTPYAGRDASGYLVWPRK